MMDIRTLYTLIAIADCGSFAEAGNRIGLSLSAVSMQVRALEEELEIAIFDRSRRPPVLTDAGLALVHRARDLIAHWESMSAALKKGTGAGLLSWAACIPAPPAYCRWRCAICRSRAMAWRFTSPRVSRTTWNARCTTGSWTWPS